MNKKKVIIVHALNGDWSQIYIDGETVLAEHRVGWKDMLPLAEAYSFKAGDIMEVEAGEKDDEISEQTGEFPRLLSELIDTF